MTQLEELKEKLYNKTNSGLDIITDYLPAVAKALERNKRKFKLREDEDAPSAHIYAPNLEYPFYRVVDFGDDSHIKDAIRIVMDIEGGHYNEKLLELCARYGVSLEIDSNKNKPRLEFRPLTKDETPETVLFKLASRIPQDVFKILGPNVTEEHTFSLGWHYVEFIGHVIPKDSKSKHAGEMCVEYPTDSFPILARKCSYLDNDGKRQAFYKIYKPYAEKCYRFMYHPTNSKPKNYINGLMELKSAHEIFMTHQEEVEVESGKEKETKLPCAVICCGERDSLCCRSMGYNPIWFNSETYTPTMEDIDNIRQYVKDIYFIPDNDETGRRRAIEIAMKHMDLKLVWLPDWLGAYKDHRGGKRKDLRDWMEIRNSPSDFKDLLKEGVKTRFYYFKNEGKENESCVLNPSRLYNFLSLNGFYSLYSEGTDKATYIRVERNIAKMVTCKDIKQFMNSWARQKRMNESLRNAIYCSKLFGSESMANLMPIDMRQKTFTADSEMFFFPHQVIEVRADAIRKLSYNESLDKYVWHELVQKYDYKEHSSYFQCDDSKGYWDIKIYNTDSPYFKYLINSSRLHWREELEYGFQTEEEKDEYCRHHHYCIDGERLAEKQIKEQKLTLVAKIYCLGYLMHSFKVENRTLAPVCMDYKIGTEGECNGRSGKSVFFSILKSFKNTLVMNGKKTKVADGRFSLDRYSPNNKLILFDDCTKDFDFESLYEMITSDFVIEKKYQDSEAMNFKDSPKIAITTNYTPKNFSPSSEGRTLYEVFSDYYHVKTKDNDYLENRDIESDVGYVLYSEDYPEECWQFDYSFLFQCLKFYLGVKSKGKITPPLDNIVKRMINDKIGVAFKEWADSYFVYDEANPENNVNINTYLNKEDVYKHFNTTAGGDRVNMWSFTKKLRKYFELFNGRLEFNPADLCNQNRRIKTTKKGRNIEMIYIRSNSR